MFLFFQLFTLLLTQYGLTNLFAETLTPTRVHCFYSNTTHLPILSIQVLERGSQKLLPAIEIQSIQTLQGETTTVSTFTTDSTGLATLTLSHSLTPATELATPSTTEEKTFQVKINESGYKKFNETLLVSCQPQETSPVIKKIYLEKIQYQKNLLDQLSAQSHTGEYETTIQDSKSKPDLSTRSLRAQEIRNLPGSNNDPIKAIQNLPGVNRPQSFSSQVVIQGGEPKDTRYTLEKHEIPLIFHFGGLSSVLFPESLDQINYSSAGYGASQGRALSGIIGATTATPRSDRFHLLGYFDLFNAGAAIETPITSTSSLFFGIRKSYIGEVLQSTFKNKKEFNLTTAPSFLDSSLVYQQQLIQTPEKKLHLKLVGIASEDQLKLVINPVGDSNPIFRGNLSNKTSFFRIIPELTFENNQGLLSSLSIGYGKDRINVALTDNYFKLATTSLTSRYEISQNLFPNHLNDRLRYTAGIDHKTTWADVGLNLYRPVTEGGIMNPIANSTRDLLDVHVIQHESALYQVLNFQANEQWSVSPQLRLDYFSALSHSHSFKISPRFQSEWKSNDSLKFNFSTGLYFQPPQNGEATADYGNPALQAQQAWHATLGYDKKLNNLDIKQSFFYKFLDQLILPTKDSSHYQNSGRGRAYGIETSFEYHPLNSPWSTALYYTLSRSDRWQRNLTPIYASSYDQTHLLNILGSYQLPRQWKLSGRFRLVSGNPYTPITSSIYNSTTDTYYPVRGDFYSQRLSPFYQFDLRIDKQWIFDSWILTFYIDIQNLTNHRNTESINYSYDYSQREDIKGLPILPTLGLRGEF